MSVGEGLFGELFMLSFCFLILSLPLFFHKEVKNNGEEPTKRKIRIVLKSGHGRRLHINKVIL